MTAKKSADWLQELVAKWSNASRVPGGVQFALSDRQWTLKHGFFQICRQSQEENHGHTPLLPKHVTQPPRWIEKIQAQAAEEDKMSEFVTQK